MTGNILRNSNKYKKKENPYMANEANKKKENTYNVNQVNIKKDNSYKPNDVNINKENPYNVNAKKEDKINEANKAHKAQKEDKVKANKPYQQQLLMTIHGCEDTCEMMTTYVANRPDVSSRVTQLSYLRDCADICGLTAKYIARNSDFSKNIAELCAYICEMCGKECAKYTDPQSQNCAKVCMHCAKECKAYAMARMIQMTPVMAVPGYMPRMPYMI